MTNKNHYISTATVPIAIKLDMVVTYHEGLLPIPYMNLWSRGPAKSHNKLKPLYLQ